MQQTIDQKRSTLGLGGLGKPLPGVVLVSSESGPRFQATRVDEQGLVLGRHPEVGLAVEDGAVSRRHACVERVGGEWRVQDLGSRNGTFVDEKPVLGELRGDPRVLRIGSSLFLLCEDVRPHLLSPLKVEPGLVLGPAMRGVLDEIQRFSRVVAVLHVTGESGTGKEVAARAFHAAGPRPAGPFVAVNCATIPKELAERLLFGARKGAYSGADADAEGYVQAADRGTLFLDEVGELEPSVQAKLLRVLESREVLPLGATKARPVDVRICSATLRSLRELVADGRFREDLYFRLGRPHVALPPLRDRREEIPWLIDMVLADVDPLLRPRPSFIETCLCRTWPGNVRELLTELRAAAAAALAAGNALVEAAHLAPQAGLALHPTTGASQPPASSVTASQSPPTKELIEDALRREGGNVSAAARRLGLHRTQLRRWLTRYAIDPREVAEATGEG
jgi:DNA-binding NtrC family response regulator